MHQKINRYILLTTFLLLFPSISYYIQVPLKQLNDSLTGNYSFKQNNFYSTYFRRLSQIKTKFFEKKKFNQLYSYLKHLENNLFTYEIKIGSDEQIFNVIVDTGSSILWIPGEGSEDKDVQIIHHYNSKTSLTSQKTNREYKIRYGSGYSLGYYYYDQIKLFNISNNKFNFYMNFGVANKTKFNIPGADGVIGFGKESNKLSYSPIFNLKNNSYIDKAGFSFKYNSILKSAILFLGDEHEDFINNSIGVCPLISDNHKEKNFWSCKLYSFGIAYNELNSSINLNLSVIFDTGTNAIVLPKYILSFIKNELKKIDCSINDISLEISNIVCYNKNTLPDIFFEIGDYYLTLSKAILYYEQSLHNGSIAYILNVYFEEGVEIGIIGLPFFFEFHTRFDLDKNEIKFFHNNNKKIRKSFARNHSEKVDVNYKLKILIIFLSFIALILSFIIIKYKYCFNKKKNSIKIENIEITSSTDNFEIFTKSNVFLD